jgi:hypothetical protein
MFDTPMRVFVAFGVDKALKVLRSDARQTGLLGAHVKNLF